MTNEDATLKDKHIFVDFYMQRCFWCYDFQQDWNQLVTDFTEEYGDKVVFMKIDGPNLYQIS